MKLLLGTNEGVYAWDATAGLARLWDGARARALARRRPDSPRIYAAAGERQALRSDDGGRTWRALPAAFERFELSSLAVHPRDDDHVLAGLESSALFESRDGGESWLEIEAIRSMAEAPDSGWHVPWGPARGHVRAPAWDAEEPRRLYLPIEVGGVVRTEDGGETWENVHGGIHDDVHAVAVHPQQNRIVYAATRTGFGRSEDYGRSFTATNTGLEHRYCRTIAIDAADGDCLYTAGASASPGGWQRPSGAETVLFRSRDGARTWERLENGLPRTFAPYINALATDPGLAGHVYFVTDAGEMYHSPDYGDHWIALGQAPPTRSILVMA